MEADKLEYSEWISRRAGGSGQDRTSVCNTQARQQWKKRTKNDIKEGIAETQVDGGTVSQNWQGEVGVSAHTCANRTCQAH